MKKPIVMLLAISAFATTLLFAQDPGDAPDPSKFIERRIKFLTRGLQLTEDQQAQATTIFTKAAEDSAPLRADLKAARESLHTAVQSAGDITGLSNTIGTLTGQLTLIKATADAAFWNILTPDQQTKLKHFEAFRGGHRRGGPHGNEFQGGPAGNQFRGGQQRRGGPGGGA